MTRGHRGSLTLRCRAFPSPPPCRFIPALQTPEPDSTQASATSLDCQDGFPAVYAELDGLEGDERTDRLVELAQEEGELMVYTSNNEMPDVAPAFAEEFDIATEVYRAPSDAV